MNEFAEQFSGEFVPVVDNPIFVMLGLSMNHVQQFVVCVEGVDVVRFNLRVIHESILLLHLSYK